MLKFNDPILESQPPIKTIADVSSGTVFAGHVWSRLGEWRTGVFMRLSTASPVTLVSLYNDTNSNWFWLDTDREIRNYRVLRNPTIIEGC